MGRTSIFACFEDERIIEMLLQGFTYQQIGDELGYTGRQIKSRARMIGAPSPINTLQHTFWSVDEMEYLQEQVKLAGGTSMELYRDVAKYLGRTPKSVSSCALTLKLGESKDRWTDAEIEMLIELNETCTAAQIAQYLGKTKRAVHGKVEWLKANGREIHCTTGLSKVPWSIGSRPLLAKSCIECGRFLASKMFTRNSKTGKYHSQCCDCRNATKKVKRNELVPKEVSLEDGTVKVEMVKRGQVEHSRSVELFQEITAETAHNRYQPYTDKEVEILHDTTKSNVVAALELGRTWAGVQGTRTRLGIKPRVAAYKERRENALWVIQFVTQSDKIVAESKAELIKKLGEVTDEEWE